MALVVLTFVIGNLLIAPDRAVSRQAVGLDFLPFYAAGTIARLGEFQQLYDLEAVRQLEWELAHRYNLALGENFGPFWNPPFYAWLFAPLSLIPYPAALNIWIGINLAALTAAVVMLIRMLPRDAQRDWRTCALVPLLVGTSMPFIQALTHAQNTFISLLLLCGVISAWRRQSDVLAGTLCGLMFYKPQLAAVAAMMLILTRGLRALAGLSIAVGALAVITLLTMPGAMINYLRQLPLNVHAIQVEQPYLWERHVTFKAMWRLMMQGREAGEAAAIVTALTIFTGVAVAAGLLWLTWRERSAAADDVFTGETRFIRRDRVIAATIVAAPLVMPFYFDYDLLLLCVPAVLLAGEWMMRAPGRTLHPFDRLLLGAWIALYAWTMLNPVLAAALRINVTVLLLALIAGLLIDRARRTIEPGNLNICPAEVIRVSARRAA